MLGILNKKRPKALKGTAGPRYCISRGSRISNHADGVVFLHVETGVLFKANRVGARIWEGAVRQLSPEAIASQISQEYAVPVGQVEADTAGFLAELEAQGFLCRTA